MPISIRHLLFLAFAVATAAQNADWYQMQVDRKFLTIGANGWLKYATADDGEPVYFKDVPYEGSTSIMIMTGRYANTKLGAACVAPMSEKVCGSSDKKDFKLGWTDCKLSWTGCPYGGAWLLLHGDKFMFHFKERPETLCITKQKPCVATQITGYWAYVGMIAGTVAYQFKVGTTKTYEQSRSQAWTHSVSVAAEVSFGIEAIGGGGKITTSYSFNTNIAEAYRQAFSTTTEETWSVQFDANSPNKAIWQFKASVTDSCSHVEISSFKEYALTPNRDVVPCCVPGYTNNAPTYSICTKTDTLIEKNAKYCSVAAKNRRSSLE